MEDKIFKKRGEGRRKLEKSQEREMRICKGQKKTSRRSTVNILKVMRGKKITPLN